MDTGQGPLLSSSSPQQSSSSSSSAVDKRTLTTNETPTDKRPKLSSSSSSQSTSTKSVTIDKRALPSSDASKEKRFKTVEVAKPKSSSEASSSSSSTKRADPLTTKPDGVVDKRVKVDATNTDAVMSSSSASSSSSSSTVAAVSVRTKSVRDCDVRIARISVDEVKLVCRVKKQEDILDRFKEEVVKDEQLLDQEEPGPKLDPLLGLPSDEILAGKKRELESLLRHGVYREVPRSSVPKKCRVISTRWVLKEKGGLCKARLVARDFNFSREHDSSCFAPTPALGSLRFLIAHCSSHIHRGSKHVLRS